MTDGDGREHGSASADEPLTVLSATDDAEISALLRSLPPVSMPDDLAERIDRAVAAEAVSRGTTGAATVVALQPAKRRRWSESPFRAVAAGLIVVVAAGGIFFAVKGSTTGGSANSAGAQATPTVTTSNHLYTKANLGAQVLALTAAAHAANSGTSALAGAPDAASLTPAPQSHAAAGASAFGDAQPATTAKAGLTTPANLRACLDRIKPGAKPVALDAGYYNGQPALVIVLPSAAYQHAYSVYVVGANCGPSRDDFLYYQLVQTR